MKKMYVSFVLSCFLVMMTSKNLHSSSCVEIASFELADTTTLEVIGGYSHVTWTGYKIGGQHTGKIEVSQGDLQFVDSSFIGGQIELDITTISNTDIEDEASKTKLVNHLKSADFFDVENHPKATYIIDQVIPYGKVGENETKYKIVGQLTLKGVTKTVKMPASFFEYDNSYSVSARLHLDRSDYNIKYGSGTFFGDIGDKVIYDEVLLDVTLSVRK